MEWKIRKTARSAVTFRAEKLTLENQLKRSEDYLNMLLQRKGP